MTCSACSSHVDRAVSKLTGVDKVNVQLLSNSMQITFDETTISDTTICDTVTKAGYPTTIKGETSIKTATVKDTTPKDESKEMRLRLLTSFSFLIPLMYISMGPMIGLPISPLFLGEDNAIINAFTQFLLCLPILHVNRRYFTVGLKKLITAKPNMDSLIAVGSGASFLYGIIAIYMITYGQNNDLPHLVHSYMHDIYFESAATILTLITLGKYLESRSKGKTTQAIEKLLDLAPKTAIRLIDDVEEEVPIENIAVDDILVIKPGAKAAVDGVVIKGYSSMDESALTGESIPVEKQVGDTIMSASTNNTGLLLIRATKVGENSTISQIIKLVEEASNSKAPISKLADKVSGVFVPVVMGISLLSFIYWYVIAGQELSFAVSIAIAVLVISCPCALGLATPVAIMVGTGVGAANGILIKSGEALEIAHRVDTVVLDKTGTITEGRPKVTDVLSLDGFSKEHLLKTAYSIERFSEHPLASAINEHVKDMGFPPAEIMDYSAVPGKGIIGTLGDKNILAGNLKLLEEHGLKDDRLTDMSLALADSGKTPLFFSEDKKVLGVIAVADTVKPTSKDAVALLKKLGLKVIMLTGDNKRTANAIAGQVDADEIIADVLPADKESVVRELKEKGNKVAMIGDGINDAPALARADVGIAIGAGMDIAIDSADMVLMKSDLMDAVTAIKLSKAVIQNIKGNLFWAFFYNTVGIPIAAGLFFTLWGFRLNPMIAAAAMSLSSVCVVTNALRLKLFIPYKSNINIENITKKEKSMKKTIVIEGMMCGHCTGRVNDVLNAIEGVTASVSLEDKEAAVELNENISDDVLREAVTNAGYKVISIN